MQLTAFRSCVKIEVAVLGFLCPNEPYSFCGCKATLNHAYTLVTVCPKYVNLTSEDIKLYIIIVKIMGELREKVTA